MSRVQAYYPRDTQNWVIEPLLVYFIPDGDTDPLLLCFLPDGETSRVQAYYCGHTYKNNKMTDLLSLTDSPDTLRVCQGQCACTVSGYKQRYQYKNQHLRLLSQKCIPKVLNFFSMNRISINFNECLYIDRSYLFDLSTSSAYKCHSVEVSN